MHYIMTRNRHADRDAEGCMTWEDGVSANSGSGVVLEMRNSSHRGGGI